MPAAFFPGAYYSGVLGWQCGSPAWGSCSHLVPAFPGAMAGARGLSREHWPGSQDGSSQALLLHCSVTLDRPRGLSGPLFLRLYVRVFKKMHLGMMLWWFILCVSLAGPWCPDLWSDIIPDISVGGGGLDEINI